MANRTLLLLFQSGKRHSFTVPEGRSEGEEALRHARMFGDEAVAEVYELQYAPDAKGKSPFVRTRRSDLEALLRGEEQPPHGVQPLLLEEA
ncbi:MAG: hypothetical protein QW196_06720 [Sulfolobales archaeon]